MAIFSMWSSAGCLVAASLLAGVSATMALSSVFPAAVGYIASAAISSSFTAGHLWPDQRKRLIYLRCRHNFLLSGRSRPGPKQPQKARKSSSSHAHLSMVRHPLDSSGTVSASPKHDLGPKTTMGRTLYNASAPRPSGRREAFRLVFEEIYQILHHGAAQFLGVDDGHCAPVIACHVMADADGG